MKRISGVSLPITTEIRDSRSILVGTTERWKETLALADSQLHPEGFMVKTVGDNLILAGKDVLGTLFGVYAFLETLGCRWFFPGEEGEEIPEIKDIEIGSLNIIENPVMKYRSLCIEDHCNESDLLDFVDWFPKVKQNFFYLDCRWYNKKALQAAAKRGLKVHFGSHSFNFFLLGHKEYERVAKERLYPQVTNMEEFFNSHREYYPGRETWGGSLGFQFCTTHPEVIERMKKNIIAFIEEYSCVELIDLFPQDIGEKSFCTCPRCKAEGTVPERYWKLI